jgi:beta-lactam-binding protein with PASTA domain/tRNA A-37 threonylcarbamoyl transferase component Bud32
LANLLTGEDAFSHPRLLPMDTTLSAPIGQLLDGRYLVESQLARGGMATVYLGRDVRLERIVALKIAHPELARDPEFTDRFIGEARAVARLSSPNVVAVFDQGSTGDINYIAMEYVPGPTLRELLNARGRLSPREALDIVEAVLTGLAAAHEAGIIHRDVKPENVLLGTGSAVKVADFGLARAAAGLRNTKTGLLIGTAAYLAPEQVASNSSDARTDVYASGVMLFEMLTGAQPHTGDTPLAVAYKHVNAVVPAPSSLVADLPAALDALVALSTSRDPELRPPDASHFLQAIGQVRRGLPLSPPRRGAHAAPAAPAGNGHYQTANGSGPETFGVTAPGGIGGESGRGGPPAYRSDQGTASGPPNHTMIVPAGGLDPEYDDGRHVAGPGPRRSRGYREPFLQRWLFSRRILVVLAALVIAAGAWWITAGQYFSLPQVTKMTVHNAEAALRNAGLTVKVGTATHSDTVASGDVLTTDPGPGSQVKHGQVVTLIPSLGPVEVSVPNVTGQALASAQQALQAAGLTAAAPTYETSGTVPVGVVISTTPVATTNWPKDQPVQIVVSAGPPLPDFVGIPFSQAQGEAGSVGVTLQMEMVAKSNTPAQTVLRQSPAAGSAIKSGEVVVVWVSPGPPQVAVPDVQGMSQQQAIQTLQAAGFQVSVNDTFGGAVGQKVTSYSPTGQAPKGSTITINIGLNF